MRPAGGAILRVSRTNRRMDVRRHCVPFHRLSGGHTVGRLSVYLHVDLCGSLSGRTQTTALRDGADEDAVKNGKLIYTI